MGMGMKKIYSPSSVIELSILKSMLDGENIRYVVENDNLGSLFEGPQISWFNSRSIMVMEEDEERAREIIQDYLDQAENQPDELPEGERAKSKKLNIIAMILFAWAVMYMFLMLKNI